MSKAMEGIRVLELTQVQPGAYCTQMMADMGADVIKIEFPKLDETAGSRASQGAEGAVNDFTNRNKRSIITNLKSTQGQEILQRLVKTADILVEGFRPGVMARLGSDYWTLRQINPRLIYCSLSGYGLDGPYKDLPGHDINYISFAGCLSLIGEAERRPTIPLNLVADYGGAAMHGLAGMLFALLARERTGRGQLVDVSYLDAAVALTAATPLGMAYLRDGVVPKRGESMVNGAYPYYNIYETADNKFITIACTELRFWEKLCRALGREDLTKFNFARGHLVQKPDAEVMQAVSTLRDIFVTRTRDEWFEYLKGYGICVAKVLSLDEVFSDPQVLHRQMLIERDDPRADKVRQPGIAIKLSDTPGEVGRPAPYAGENTEEILKELGYDLKTTTELRQAGVVS